MPDTSSVISSQTKTDSSGPGSVCLSFTTVGFLVTVVGWWLYMTAVSSANWPTTAADVTAIEVVKHSLSKGRFSGYTYNWHPVVHFHLRANGKDYESSTDLGPKKDELYALSFFDKYPKGTKFNVQYNPDWPSQTTIEPGENKDLYKVMIVFGLVMFFGGAVEGIGVLLTNQPRQEETPY
jgi:hypothetical protein